MPKRTNDRTTTQRFTDLFRDVEKSDAYLIEGAKVEIAERIHLTMKQKNISRAELARSLGKSRAYVTKVLQGDTNFTIDSLVKIASALDCDLELQFRGQCTASRSSKTEKREITKRLHQDDSYAGGRPARNRPRLSERKVI